MDQTFDKENMAVWEAHKSALDRANTHDLCMAW